MKEKQMELFNPYEKIIEKVKGININDMTPVEALNVLDELINEIKKLS